MDDENIKLIIKAPNQNIDDQTVECNINWTVTQLKTHLSQVYPNKPDVKDQKLIYSGRLLKDQSQLKEILRQNENDTSVYTVHLVCSRQNKTNYTPDSMSSESSQNESQSSSSESASNSDQGSVLRQRHVPVDNSQNFHAENTEATIPPPPGMEGMNNMSYLQQQQYAFYYYQNPQMANASPPLPAFNMASQMSAYQQAMANYYSYMMQNSQQVPAAAAAAPAVDPVPNVANLRPTDQPVAEERNNINPPPPPPAPRAAPNRNIRMNAQGGMVMDDNDEGANRDWLDYFYLCCRGFVLFSIVYFYSSPERLMLVVGLTFLAFLYQEGWVIVRRQNNWLGDNIPWRQQPIQNENQNNTDESPPPSENATDEDHLEEHEIEATMDGDNPPHARNPDPTNQQNPAWTFIASFFSSLIPEPPPPVNLN